MDSPPFQVLFCQHFDCPASDYERRAFKEFLYLRARVVAPLIRMLNPGFFTEDFKFIRDLGEAADLREANASAADFQSKNAARSEFWRTALRIRVSGLKASRLAHQLFAQTSDYKTRLP